MLLTLFFIFYLFKMLLILLELLLIRWNVIKFTNLLLDVVAVVCLKK